MNDEHVGEFLSEIFETKQDRHDQGIPDQTQGADKKIHSLHRRISDSGVSIPHRGAPLRGRVVCGE